MPNKIKQEERKEKKNKDLLFIDYGEIDEILVAYKIGRITLEETKRILKFILK